MGVFRNGNKYQIAIFWNKFNFVILKLIKIHHRSQIYTDYFSNRPNSAKCHYHIQIVHMFTNSKFHQFFFIFFQLEFSIYLKFFLEPSYIITFILFYCHFFLALLLKEWILIFNNIDYLLWNY